MEKKIVYFENPGKANTPQILSLVKAAAPAGDIHKIVLASTRGATARAALEIFAGTRMKLVVVPWQYHFKDTAQAFPRDLVAKIEGKGHRVHFGTMLFHTEGLYGTKTPTIMANLLRIFGQGMKVCVEIIMMACDGGCLAMDEPIIAIAGTAAGADTAIVATAAPSTKLTRLRIHEIICKPLLARGGHRTSV